MIRTLSYLALALVIGATVVAQVRHRTRSRDELTSETRRRVAVEVERIVYEHEERDELADRSRDSRKARPQGFRDERVRLRDRIASRLARWLRLGAFGSFGPDRETDERSRLRPTRATRRGLEGVAEGVQAEGEER